MAPLFLFQLLRGLRIGANLGHDVNAMLGECLDESVMSCAMLVDLLIQRFKRGNYPHEASVLAACTAAVEHHIATEVRVGLQEALNSTAVYCTEVCVIAPVSKGVKPK